MTTTSRKRRLLLWTLLLGGLMGLPQAARTIFAQDLLEQLAGQPEAEQGEEEDSPSLLDAARRDAVRTEMRLTNQQLSDIDQIIEEFDQKAKELQDSVSEQLKGIESIGERLRKTAELRGQQRDKTDELRKKAEQQLLALINGDQKATLQKRAAEMGADVSASGLAGAGDRGASSGRSRDSTSRSSSSRSYNPPTSNGPVVASFAAIETPPEDASDSDRTTGDSKTAGSQRADGDRGSESAEGQSYLSFRFQDAPWPDVLQRFANAAGLTLNIRDNPPGQFSYYDDRRHTPAEALDVMNRYLMPDGFLLVRHDRFLTVFDTKKGIPPNLIETVSLEDLSRRGRTELVRVVFPLDARDAEKTAGEIRGLLGPQGQVSPLESANSLVVTDVASNLAEVKDLLGLEPKVGKDDLTFRSFELQYISAHDAAQIIKNLFPKETGAQDPGAAAAARLSTSRSRRFSRFSSRFRGFGDRRGGDDDNNRRSENGGQSSSADTPTVAVAVDARTNSVLVRARLSDLQLIEEAVKALDVEQGGRTFVSAAQRAPDEPYLQVYELKAADVDDVIQTLQAIYPDAMFNEDDDTDRVHAFATEEQHRVIAMQLRQIDGAVGGDSVAVIPLGGLSAYDAGTMVTSLYLRDGQNAPSVQVDPYGRNLIVRGSASQVSQIRMLLEQYGAGRAGSSSPNGPIVRIPVSNPEEIARMIERLWSISNPNPIRVMPRDDRSRRPTVEPPVDRSGRRREPARENRQNRPPGRTDAAVDEDGSLPGGANVFTASRLQVAEGEPKTAHERPAGKTVGEEGRNDRNETPDEAELGRDESENQDEPKNESESQAPPIIVSVEDGELVIISEDQQALSRLQELIGSLARTSPARTSWKVFYLRAADATEVATMLAQLLPVGPAVGTADATGFSVAGAGPQTLQIIPESRMNALFVTGPPDQVQDVERFLKVLDSDELPPSLRDRVPRSIPVRYANVSEVAEIVRNVYQDYMQPPSRRRGRGFFGRSGNDGGNSNGNSSQPNGVRLTLGVDTRTSQLIVSCSDSLYQEIDDLVATLDEAAYEAEQIVRVVPSDNGAMVAETLDALFPQVTISTTASPPGQTDSSSTSSASPNGRSRGDADAERAERIRRFMEFRERMRRGGGGGFFGPRRGGGGDGRGGFSRGGNRDRDRGGRFRGRD